MLIFLKKKKQKDFFFDSIVSSNAKMVKSFLVIFFKKERFLLFFLLLSAAPARAADPSPAWPHFEIILYQTETAAQLTALRDIGVSAAMLRARRDDGAAEDPHLARLQALGFRFYVENIATDFYSAYHRWQGETPVNAAFLTDQALHRQNPAAIAPFLRAPSLVDRHWRNIIARRIARIVASFRADRPLYYDLADEAGIGDLSAAWDFDFSPLALETFRASLRDQYHDLAALNHEWGTRYRRWGEVMPETTDQALRRTQDDLAPWADFKAWMDVSFAAAVRAGSDAIHAADPRALAALEGAQIPGWGGYNYTHLAGAVDVMEIYDFGASVAIARAMNPKLITLMTIAGADPASRAALWHGALAGMGGVILWDESQALATADGRLGPWGRAAAADFAALRGRLGDLLLAAKRPTDPIAILYSPASFRVRWLLDRAAEGGDWAARGADAEYQDNPQSHAIAGFLHLLGARGWQPEIISPARLSAGGLRAGGFRVLVLPESIALSDAEIAAIGDFTAGGGVVIANTTPGLFDAHGKRRPAPALGGAAMRLDPGQEDAEARLTRVLAAAGLTPPLTLTTASGTWPEDVTVTRLLAGGRPILALQRDLSAAPRTPLPLTLTLPRACRVEDLRAKRDFGWRREVTLSLDPVVPTILACS